MIDLYRAAVSMLPGWSDKAIMACDLGRLNIAVDAARQRIESEWRQRYRIAGFKVDEPSHEPDSDEAFNDQIRETIALMQRSFAK